MISALFTGASRSGKSALAQAWVERRAASCIYLATAEIRDAEMNDRVALHQAARGRQWRTLELCRQGDPYDVVAALHSIPPLYTDNAVLLDCTTLWLASLLEIEDDAAILMRVDALVKALRVFPLPVAIVHNEVGWGLVPEYPLGRRFRDVSGHAGQRLAAACSCVVLAVCGLPQVLKGTHD